MTSNDSVSRFLAQYTKVDDAERRSIARNRLRQVPSGVASGLVKARLDGHGGEPLPETLYLYQQFGLVDDMLHYFDRTSMAHSLEVRVPFLDHHVVELAARIPSRLKVDGRLNGKALLRRVARGLVPEQIVEKRKIGFFSGAIDGWFRAQIHGKAAEWLLEPSDAADELFDPTEVQRLVAAARRGERANTQALLALLMLKVWLVDTLPRATSAQSPLV